MGSSWCIDLRANHLKFACGIITILSTSDTFQLLFVLMQQMRRLSAISLFVQVRKQQPDKFVKTDSNVAHIT